MQIKEPKIKKPKIEIKELSYIRVLSDDRINPTEMDNIVGGFNPIGITRRR